MTTPTDNPSGAEGSIVAGPKFPGVKRELGDKTFIIPALAFSKLKELRPRLDALQLADDVMPSDADMETMLDMLLAAINRNYPDVTRADLDELVDFGNVGDLIRVVTGQTRKASRDLLSAAGGQPDE